MSIDPNTIWIDGKLYDDKKDVAKAYGISISAINYRLSKGWTYEQIVGLEKYVPPKVIYKGKDYESERALAESFGIEYTTYKLRLAKGWTQEDALSVIPEDKELKGKLFRVEDTCPFIKELFNTNPYCVLGISALSKRKDAIIVSEKLKKYDKLNILQNYVTEFDLVNLQHPNRGLGHVQIVMTNLDKMQFRWMWFAEPFFASSWNRKLFGRASGKQITITYDAFLACMYNCLISDSKYNNKTKWDRLFNLINKIYKKDEKELFAFISEHITQEDKKKYNYIMIVSSFRNALKSVFFTNIDEQSIADNSKFLEIIKRNMIDFKDELIERIANKAVLWVNDEAEAITEVYDKLSNKGDSNLSLNDAREMLEPIEAFDSKSGFVDLESIAIALENTGIYSELLRERIRKAVWNATTIVSKAGEVRKAARYDSKIYMYCNEEQKKQLKNFYYIENMDLPDSEITADECDEAADRFRKSTNKEMEFYWRLKAANKGKLSAMNSVGVAYALGYGVEKNEGKAVEWYEKAASKGDAYALGNLASRYYNGSLPGGREKAKEYWIIAYSKNRACDGKKQLDLHYPGWMQENNAYLKKAFNNMLRSHLEPYANDGIIYAQFLMGKYLTEGCSLFGVKLWKQNKEEGLEWLKKAAKSGSELAKAYAKEKHGIDLYPKEFQIIDDTKIYSGFDTSVYFCGVIRRGGRYGLKFWVYNFSKEDRCIWIKNCRVSGSKYGVFFKLGDFEAREGHYKTLFIDTIDFTKTTEIELEIELDDTNNTEILTLCKLKVILNGITKGISFTSKKLEVHNSTLKEYYLSSKGFTEEIIFEGPVDIFFCGVNLDSYKFELVFDVYNMLLENAEIWVKNIRIGGKNFDNRVFLGRLDENESNFFNLHMPEVFVNVQYDISIDIEIDNLHSEKLFDACHLFFRLPGDGRSDFFISYNNIGKRSHQLPIYTSKLHYASYEFNENKIILYLNQTPSLAVIDFLRKNGWNSSVNWRIWTAKYKEDNIAAAEVIVKNKYW